MTLPTNTTRLQAVNTMLSVLGSAPVNSLTPPVTSDVSMAQNILEESLKEVQADYWYFQCEADVPFTADVNSEIILPADILHADHAYKRVVVRNGKLYDLDSKTYAVGSLSLSVVYWIDFDEMPESARAYTIAKASRKFYERRTEHSERAAALYREESLAKARLMAEEAEASDATIFDSRIAYGPIMRRSPLDTMGPI